MKLCANAKCTSCKACMNACPKNCIRFVENETGYEYPVIDADVCVECGNCARVCHILNDVEFNDPKNAYAVWSLDDADRKSSTSGGAASVFYQQVLSMGGVCYGAVVDEELNVVIARYDDENVVKFKNSKYSHSDMGDTYKKIKSDLHDDKKVVFIGLPCQVAAIKSFLKKDYSNLLLVDLICHGAPPQKHLTEHISHIDEKCDKKTENIKFRNNNEFIFTTFASGEEKAFYSKWKNADSFLLPFFESLNYYESCYSCRYAQNKRISDITIGDFWGLGMEVPFDHPYTGAISLVLLNSEKGKKFFEKAKNKLFYEERPVTEAFKGNDQLNNPSRINENREKFLSFYKESGFEYAVTSIYKDFMQKEERAYKKRQRYLKIRNFIKKMLER